MCFSLYLLAKTKFKFMKILVRSFFFLLMTGFVLTSCSNNKKENFESKQAIEQKEHSHDKGAEAEDHGYEMAMSAYQCPMKCEGDKTYEEEGACPECKMDLKKIEATEKEESREESTDN